MSAGTDFLRRFNVFRFTDLPWPRIVRGDLAIVPGWGFTRLPIPDNDNRKPKG